MNLDVHGNHHNVTTTEENHQPSDSSKESTPTFSEYFDEVIGHIENLVMDEAFQNILNHFMESYYKHFDNEEENKIEYMEIFQMYTAAIESYITDSLNERLGFFDMERFAMELEDKKGSLDGEIFELLYTLTDFLAFKEMFLDYKNYKDGRCIDLSSSISVTSYKLENDEIEEEF